MAAFSLDLRQRILDAALCGDATEQAVASRFGVSKGFVQKIKRRWRRDGTAEPVGHRGGAHPKLSAEDRTALAAWVEATPDATGQELADRLATERSVRATARTLNRTLRAMGLTLKQRRSEPPNATATT